MTDNTSHTRCAAITIQNFYWRHVNGRSRVNLFGEYYILNNGVDYRTICQFCEKRRTFNTCEVQRSDWEEPCFVVCDYCTRQWPNHAKAMGTFYCEHERETLIACYRHKGECDGSAHRNVSDDYDDFDDYEDYQQNDY